jgi:hypothetical protein
LDGAGNATGSYTFVFGGGTPTFGGTFTGTYSINPDSTGSITLALDSGSTITFAFVVTDGGSGILMLQTVQNNGKANFINHVLVGTARMQ